MMVIPSEHMKEAEDMKHTMARFARFLNIPEDGPRVHNDLINKASPASKGGNVHENGRSYVATVPDELNARLYRVFCPKNQELAQLLLDKSLIDSVNEIPWLAEALKRDVC